MGCWIILISFIFLWISLFVCLFWFSLTNFSYWWSKSLSKIFLELILNRFFDFIFRSVKFVDDILRLNVWIIISLLIIKLFIIFLTIWNHWIFSLIFLIFTWFLKRYLRFFIFVRLEFCLIFSFLVFLFNQFLLLRTSLLFTIKLFFFISILFYFFWFNTHARKMKPFIAFITHYHIVFISTFTNAIIYLRNFLILPNLLFSNTTNTIGVCLILLPWLF